MKKNASTACASTCAWAGAVMAALSFLALAATSGSALAQKAERPSIKAGDQWQFSKRGDLRAPAVSIFVCVKPSNKGAPPGAAASMATRVLPMRERRATRPHACRPAAA